MGESEIPTKRVISYISLKNNYHEKRSCKKREALDSSGAGVNWLSEQPFSISSSFLVWFVHEIIKTCKKQKARGKIIIIIIGLVFLHDEIKRFLCKSIFLVLQTAEQYFRNL